MMQYNLNVQDVQIGFDGIQEQIPCLCDTFKLKFL